MEYRGYRIVPIHQMIGYEIQYVGKGSLHKSLLGCFTNQSIAKDAIDVYLNGKEEVDGETSPSSGDQSIQRRSYHRRKPTNDS